MPSTARADALVQLGLMGIWLVIFGVGALLMRAGFALQACGSLRAKNAAGGVMRVVVNTAVITLVFWAIGAAILFRSGGGLFGIETALLLGHGTSGGASPDGFFSLAIILIGGAVVTGAIAERSPFYVSTALSTILAGIIIPVVGYWAWSGWLRQMGFIDIGGATVIHLSAAACAVVGAIAVGPRAGKYSKDHSSKSIPGHALPLSSVGVLLLLVGWFPYLFGSVILHRSVDEGSLEAALSSTAMNLMLAASAGALVALLASQICYGKPDIFFTCSGLVGAMVAVSAGAGAISGGASVLIGAIAGLLVPVVTLWIDMQCQLDDPVGVIGVHGVGGLWGTLAAGVFASSANGAKSVVTQIAGIGAIVIFSALVSLAVLLVLRLFHPLRCGEAYEFEGLDLAEHDINAYPDFQQTTIKSYHLREV